MQERKDENKTYATALSEEGLSRRELVTSVLTLPLAAAALSAAPGRARAQANASKVLVAYFTRTGNTRLIATQIARATGGTLFQIVPAQPYPEEYKEQVAQAQSETESDYEPPLLENVPGFAQYETVFLGLPVWGTTAPSIIRSFLSRHDLTGKTLVPFITHGGYGAGTSLEVVRRQARGARFEREFIKQCDQERETLEQVTSWLGIVDIAR